MSSSSELNQAEMKPQSYSFLLKSFGDHQIQQSYHQPGQTQKLEEFLAHLEEEWLKIEAFKRELPLCMQLLANAMEASRQQLQTFRTPKQDEARPILEEFIPLKHANTEGTEKATNISEKSSWMISAQLWSNSNEGITKQQQLQTSKDDQNSSEISPTQGSEDKKRNVGGFLPFSKETANTCSSPTLRVLPELALTSTSTDKEMIDEKKCIDSENRISCRRRDNNSTVNIKGGDGGNSMIEQQQGKVVASSQGDAQGNSNSTSAQAHRKARRCWSPDLHRRFVNALQMLGGSQVATPKQIRELMKVDGLTNDEVKSHLQKYRLHTRRPSPSPQSAGNQTPQLVVLGSIWVPPEYAAAAAAAAHSNGGGGPTAIYSTHPASLTSTHYCATPTQVAVPQEFYATQQQSHHHLIHHNNLQLHHHPHHIYKLSPSSKTPISSPESDGNNDVSRGGNQSESIEDGKSESGNWKGDSGSGGGGGEHHNTSEDEQRRGLASLRDESDKSNGTSDEHQITLKF
ncbi:hypothetical protein MKW94_010176 [Papaver nudicaule]|uniref:HTH myb-type domain-containing protein n=1 Tax=Papaver nudicaule TaxID=74823 RepID=A0AA41RTS9_PAPNU|nr:hypothetical protein [Papaver nudicaule]